MTIRLAQTRDIPAMLRLLLQVGQVHHEIRPDIFRQGAQKYDAQALEALLRDEEKPIFIAQMGEEVAGYCFCQLRSYPQGGALAGRKELYIDDLCVDQALRGQHVGSALYAHACAFAQAQGCGYLTLNVWCGNHSAMAFYEKAGLTPRNIMMEKKLC